MDMGKFSRAMATFLSSQSDGFGFSAMKLNGEVYSYKTTYPTVYARNRRISSVMSKNVSEEIGTPGEKYKCAMFHGRTSTNEISLRNTHPIIRDGIPLIHNGVVDNVGEAYKKLTTNDSEDVLYHYLKGGIKAVSKNLTGYYACGVMDPATKTMTVFKDDVASLNYAWSDKLQSYVIATSKYTIGEIGKYIDEQLEPIEVDDNICITFDGNEVVKAENFTPKKKYNQHQIDSASKSLGKSLTVNTSNYKDEIKYEEYVSEEYLREIKNMTDAEYEIESREGDLISVAEFHDLSLIKKTQCMVMRKKDRVIIDPWDWEVVDNRR